MRKELDELLCKKYPEIFVDRNADMRTTAMCWGIECGDGWFNIIDQLCCLIQNSIDSGRAAEAQINRWREEGKPIPAWAEGHFAWPPVVAVQVKEKYGTLRFSTNGHEDEIEGAIRMAEAMSSVTCEVCGKPGVLRDGGWYRTLCDEHADGQPPYPSPYRERVLNAA